MRFSGSAFTALAALAFIAVPASGMPHQHDASSSPAVVAKRNAGAAESCYLSSWGLHEITGYTIDVDDCTAIVTAAQDLKASTTGASYYWSLDAGEKGWHCTFSFSRPSETDCLRACLKKKTEDADPKLLTVARYRTCQLSVDTVSSTTDTWVGSVDVATMVDLAVQLDVGESGGVNSTGGTENCNSTTVDTGYGDPGNVIQWYVLYWGGDEAEPEFYDQIDQDHVA